MSRPFVSTLSLPLSLISAALTPIGSDGRRAVGLSPSSLLLPLVSPVSTMIPLQLQHTAVRFPILDLRRVFHVLILILDVGTNISSSLCDERIDSLVAVRRIMSHPLVMVD